MVLQQKALCGQQFPQQLAAHLAKVTSVDAVELLGLGVRIPEIVQQGGGRRRGHGRAHVVDVLHLIVLHPAEGGCSNAHALALGLQQAAPGCGGRPLGGGGAHGPVAQGRAELPLGRAEVAGRHGQQVPRGPGTAQHCAQAQGFRHGAAGPEHPRKGHPQLPHGIAGRRALGLQVARKGQLDLLLREGGFFQAEPCGPQLQVSLRRFPAGLAEAVVRGKLVELRCQRALALFLAAHRRPGSDHRRRFKQQGIPAAVHHEQNFPFPATNAKFYGTIALRCKLSAR